MSYIDQISNPRVEKHIIMVIRPRMRVTGWEHVSGLIFRAPFTHGYVTGVTKDYNLSGTDEETDAVNGGDATPAYGEFWYDNDNGYIYAYNLIPLTVGDANSNPDLKAYPGLTVEFEIYVSDQAFTGPRDPQNANSQVVNWRPALKSSPLAQLGSRDTLFGFLPMTSSQIQLLNSDGWMNEFIYSASFNSCLVRAFLVASSDLSDAVIYSDVKEIFKGYTTSARVSGFNVEIGCADFIRFFDKEIPLRRFSDISGYTLDPAAIETGKQWFIRRVFGVHKSFHPVNADYNAIATTSNNRKWITHERDFAIDGVTAHDDGDLLYNVFAIGNTNTRTYLIETPKMRVGDSVIINVSGVDKYVFVNAVNQFSKYFDHSAISGGGSAGLLDTVTRYFIGGVSLKDPDGNIYTLRAGADFTRIVDNTQNVRGFIIANNVESTFLNTPFDPATWEISCVLYGKKSLDQYDSDSTDVGSVVNGGGVAGAGVSALYRLIVEAGFDQSEIYDGAFQNIQADSYSIGLAIPSSRDAADTPRYRDTITKILSSNLYKIGIADDGSNLVVGVTTVEPFVSAGDYSASELNHSGLEFEQDYSGVYSDFRVKYSNFEVPSIRPINDDGSQNNNNFAIKTAVSDAASRLHKISKTYELETILVEPSEAQELADHLSFTLGERRGFWSFAFELPYSNRTNQGATYRVSRQFMPGFEYAEGTQREQQLIIAEVNKNDRGVKITFEDQKGVQDNALDW